MKKVDVLQFFEHKDLRRIDILRLLMASPAALTPLLDYIQTLDFRSALGTLSGYNSNHSGELIAL